MTGDRYDEPTGEWFDELPDEGEARGRGGRGRFEDEPPHDEPDAGSGVYFPTRPIGYDRAAVDAYVEQTERRIADLEATRTPEAAIHQALDRVGEETTGILRQAQEAADDMTARARSAADARTETARRDAEELRARGEYRVRQLDADADAVWRERARLLDDVRRLAEEILTAADRADMRFPQEESPANAPLAPEGAGEEPSVTPAPSEAGEEERIDAARGGGRPGRAGRRATAPGRWRRGRLTCCRRCRPGARPRSACSSQRGTSLGMSDSRNSAVARTSCP